jgi:hypothetical protein
MAGTKQVIDDMAQNFKKLLADSNSRIGKIKDLQSQRQLEGFKNQQSEQKQKLFERFGADLY